MPENKDSIMVAQPQYMCKERWEAILACKKDFLEDKNADPRKNHYMNQAVAASWIKSRELGINPCEKPTKPLLSKEELKKVLEKNQLLIEITRPLVNSFKEMAILTSGFVLHLCDRNGTFLLQKGDMVRMSTVGLIWNEETIGTCAHSLCVSQKRPVQLLGPEHYNVSLAGILGTAAPIMDDTGEVIATLILGQPIIETPWLDSFQNLQSHTLGLITSLAAAVEAQIKLYKSNEKLRLSYIRLKEVNDSFKTAQQTLEATLSFIDEGIITIDRNGRIIHINQEGMRILKLKPEGIGLRNIKEFLGEQSHVMTLINDRKNISVEEPLYVDKDEQLYFITITPILNEVNNEVDAAILRITHAEKINAMVASRAGSIASYHFEDIIGENKDLKKNIELAKRFARSPENVLLIGESGTGKELFAQAIHNVYCPQGPFMAVNCAALPRELIESELFGYEGGSFTGAERAGRPGKIELAHGGTLFLDEIGDMPIELQPVLLRALEDKQVMRVGGRRYKKVDFRLITATNKNLYKMVKENQFREDLYFRLSVLNINIPPLRERDNDIEILSKYFIENYCRKMGWSIPQISQEALAKIVEYDWPGNVRQLQNAMVYAVNTVQDNIIKTENLPGYIIAESIPGEIERITDNVNNAGDMLRLENLEKAAIKAALIHANNSVPHAAKILGISRSTLYRKLKEYAIEH